ncbi:plasminogen-like [Glandiceps talaboti]
MVHGHKRCFKAANGVDYRGIVATTVQGHTCQKWTSQYPISHPFTPDNFQFLGLGDHNYCRNPDNDVGPWCYTIDGSKFEYCDVGDASMCECYQVYNGVDYRGTVATSVKGHTCQKWTSQHPNHHERTQQNYPYAGLGDHNYCRNPDNEPTPWCYTLDGDRFEYCDVGQPGQCGNDVCLKAYNGGHYRGTKSTTVKGHTCQKWTSQYPIQHVRTQENYPYAGLGDHNYCRNPDNDHGPWCYTIDGSRFEYCDVGQPLTFAENTECYLSSNGADYRGTVATTVKGYTCQEWSSQYPNQHTWTPEKYIYSGIGYHNYCRNPGNKEVPWCFTIDGDSFDYCDVGQPGQCDFSYKNGTFLCAGADFQCDGWYLCGANTEEMNCTGNIGHFVCATGNCIRGDLVCDGLNHCGDNSDELNCDNEEMPGMPITTPVKSNISVMPIRNKTLSTSMLSGSPYYTSTNKMMSTETSVDDTLTAEMTMTINETSMTELMTGDISMVTVINEDTVLNDIQSDAASLSGDTVPSNSFSLSRQPDPKTDVPVRTPSMVRKMIVFLHKYQHHSGSRQCESFDEDYLTMVVMVTICPTLYLIGSLIVMMVPELGN